MKQSTSETALIRRRALARRRAIDDDERDSASLAICEHAFALIARRRARRVGLYLPAIDEVNTWPLIERTLRHRRRVYVPVLEKNHRMRFVELMTGTRLVRNRYGLLQPDDGPDTSPYELDFVFAPVVAFDSLGRRIGMGGGYYDRAFAFLRNRIRCQKPKLTGLAFDCQDVGAIDAKPWDIALFQVVTESGYRLGATHK
ncbi:MAG: 5-formyltetrahydrofolate cyclo-ligase [Pseudomonadota bacterium]